MRTLGAGELEVTIEHEPLVRVTPEMLAWWYGHVRGTMPYAGSVYPRYLVWHPLDHISYEVRKPMADGAVGPGAKLHITEALGRDPRKLIDIVVTVEQLDDSGAVVGRRVLGTPVVLLENIFEAIPRGSRYVSRLTVGSSTPLGRLFLNRIARGRAFPDWKVDPWWIRHHIEEIGNLENLLPELYRDRCDEDAAPSECSDVAGSR